MKRLIVIAFLVVGCTSAPGASIKPPVPLPSGIRQVLPTTSPTASIDVPSTGTPAPSGEVGEPALECGIPEGCFLPPTDMEAP